MNHNKIHAKMMVLLTLPTSKVWRETTPALVVLLIITGLCYLPLPSVFSLWSCAVALLVVVVFNMMIANNHITYDVVAVEEAPTLEEKPEIQHIQSEETPPIEDEIEEAPVQISKAVEIVEDVDDLFNFNAHLKATYDKGTIAEMADAGANTSKKKAEEMLK